MTANDGDRFDGSGIERKYAWRFLRSTRPCSSVFCAISRPRRTSGDSGLRRIVEDAGVELGAEDAVNHVVEAVHGDFAGFDGFLEWRAEGVVAGHLDVEAGEGGFGGALRATPVGDDEPFEAEILLEDVGEGVGVLAGVGAVDAVVGAHDGAGAGVLKCDLEGEQVALAHGALADDGVGDDAAGILIVDGVVLDVA